MTIRITKRAKVASAADGGASSASAAAKAPRKRSSLKADANTPATARFVPPAIPSAPELQPIHVYGTYVETVSVIPRTMALLHLTPGKLGNEGDEKRETVLLPFAEIRLGGGALGELGQETNLDDEDQIPTLFTANLPLENLAYVLLDMTSDLKRICQEICELGDGALVVDATRMAHVRFYMAHLERQARLARIRLDRHYGVPESDAD